VGSNEGGNEGAGENSDVAITNNARNSTLIVFCLPSAFQYDMAETYAKYLGWWHPSVIYRFFGKFP
jgi:hypothetical protein